MSDQPGTSAGDGSDADRAGRGWTDQDLEAFHDGEMDGPSASALGAALRRDGSLRARLAAVVGADAAVRSLVTRIADAEARTDDTAGGLPEGRLDRRGRVAGRWRVPMALAASVCIVVGVGILLLLRGVGAVPTGGDGGSVKARVASEAASSVPLLPVDAGVSRAGAGGGGLGADRPDGASLARVVLSVPLRAPRPSRVPSEGAASTDGVDGALLVADPEQIAREMGSASLGEREAGYLAMGRTIRSAMAATEYLDGLDEQEQVRVCRLWAEDPSLRPVVFARLAMLRERGGGVRQEVDRLAGDLRARSEFVPWLRSHGLM